PKSRVNCNLAASNSGRAEATTAACGAGVAKLDGDGVGLGGSGRKTFGPLISEDQSRIRRLASAPNAAMGRDVSCSGGSFTGERRSRMLPSSEYHQPWFNSSPRSSPTLTGLDSNCSGGRVSAENTSERLLKT